MWALSDCENLMSSRAWRPDINSVQEFGISSDFVDTVKRGGITVCEIPYIGLPCSYQSINYIYSSSYLCVQYYIKIRGQDSHWIWNIYIIFTSTALYRSNKNLSFVTRWGSLPRQKRWLSAPVAFQSVSLDCSFMKNLILYRIRPAENLKSIFWVMFFVNTALYSGKM